MPRRLIALLSATLTAALGLVLLIGTNLVDRPATPAVPATPGESVAADPTPPVSSPPPPVVAARRSATYVFPLAGCTVSYSRGHHDYPAADLFTEVGCRFVSPVDGKVDEVSRTDRWDPRANRGADRGGMSVSVIGTDGVRYYGAHLSAVAASVRPGLPVRAGQDLGRTGNTGSARPTPPHLHFGISWPTPPGQWWIRRGAVSPQPFLDAWRTGHALSPAATVRKAKAAYGPTSHCRSYC